MADYYPLVAKAVAGLEKNTGEGRRMLYERARTALVAQLRGMNDPPLTEAEITRERLALEEAIRKVEAEAARRARGPAHAGTPAVAPNRAAGTRSRAEPVRGARARTACLDLDARAGSPGRAAARPAAAKPDAPALGRRHRRAAEAFACRADRRHRDGAADSRARRRCRLAARPHSGPRP